MCGISLARYVVERAVQRLLAAAEGGKTGDIIDCLDIGADVNCVNEVG
jgi:23S rRNA A1618 N6-methylase RlmF